MKFPGGHHLGYCTNIHRGETFAEIFHALETHTLAVRDRVAAGRRYGIGLRLGATAARELQDSTVRLEFQRWLGKNDCYIFTINGFPYGQFHGTRVKANVYRPDWTSPDRLAYTNLLFDLLAELVPEGEEGSVSTLPLSFKPFGIEPWQRGVMRDQLQACARHIEKLASASGRDLHLGLEPEPLCTLETSDELIEFFGDFDEATRRVIGMNYDTCHLAVEFEDPSRSLARLREAGVRISKFHLSSALKLKPLPEAIDRLREFSEDTYLHQVIVRESGGALRRFVDLDVAMAEAAGPSPPRDGDEWRVHFHVPVHAQPERHLGDTRDHIEGVLRVVAADPSICRHFEIETYTWEVLPPALRQPNVVDQIAREYAWVLGEWARHGLT